MNLYTSLVVLTFAIACNATDGWGPWGSCKNGFQFSFKGKWMYRWRRCEAEVAESWSAWGPCVNGKATRKKGYWTQTKTCVDPNKPKVAESWGEWTACENGKSKMYRLPDKMSWRIRSCKSGITAEGAPQSDAEQRCLDKHNEYRRAHGKKELKWNSKIAASARDWATKQSQGSGMNMVHSKGTGYGENMAWASGVASGTEGEEAVKRWYDEICLYDSCDPPSGVTGHYTQVVWTDSEYVGCAVVTNGGGVYTVAQYYPPGNYKGEYCTMAGTPDEVKTLRNKACGTR